MELESVSVMLAMGERVREDRCQWGHDYSLAFNNRLVTSEEIGHSFCHKR